MPKCRSSISIRLQVACIALFASHGGDLFADRTIQGDINSETWIRNDGLHAVVADTTVQSGHTLRIEPGVEVVAAPGVVLTVRGNIVVAGSVEDRVSFRSVDPTNLGSNWQGIHIVNPSASSDFSNCDIANATIGVHVALSGTASDSSRFTNCDIHECETGIKVELYSEPRANITISGCRFSATSCGAIWGGAQSHRANCAFHEARLTMSVTNCLFDSTTRGCEFVSRADSKACGLVRRWGRGTCVPTVRNNIFKDVEMAALNLVPLDEGAGAAKATFVNNTVVNCGQGLVTASPFNAEVRNNIFFGSGSAVTRSGDTTLSGVVSHNCFHDNQQRFEGYPGSYGQVFWKNPNGFDADLSFNIFEDPQFVGDETYMLSADSPCVDSGCATNDCSIETYNDICVPPSRGTAIGDIGAYGGPGACELIPPAPPETEFLRGDANFDSAVDMSDATTILGYLFVGEPAETTCAKTMDADDNSFLEITDGVFVLRYQFLGSTPPPAPFEFCGSDSTADPLPCEIYPRCGG